MSFSTNDPSYVLSFEWLELLVALRIQERDNSLKAFRTGAVVDGGPHDWHEDAAWQYAEEQLRLSEAALRASHEYLTNSEIIEDPTHKESVNIGSLVSVIYQGEDDAEILFIAGNSSTLLKNRDLPLSVRVSYKSPVGMALLDSVANTSRSYQLPEGRGSVKIFVNKILGGVNEYLQMYVPLLLEDTIDMYKGLFGQFNDTLFWKTQESIPNNLFAMFNSPALKEREKVMTFQLPLIEVIDRIDLLVQLADTHNISLPNMEEAEEIRGGLVDTLRLTKASYIPLENDRRLTYLSNQ